MKSILKKSLSKITFFAMISVLLTVMSCEKSDGLNNISESSSAVPQKKDVTFHLYYATWDERGRASIGCEGWGLCNFLDCGFCCTDEYGMIVDCVSESPVPNSGLITINDATNEGRMVVQLDPNNEGDNSAILNQDTLFVDLDIYSDYSGTTITIEAGEYLFNSGIGQYGGYILNAHRSN